MQLRLARLKLASRSGERDPPLRVFGVLAERNQTNTAIQSPRRKTSKIEIKKL